jgi:acetoin utilization deacetylase AcuC-like enzyme
MGILDVLIGRRFPFKFVYHEEYWMVNTGKHVFPVRKYRMIHERLANMGARKDHFLKPHPAPDEALLLVHTAKYLKKLNTGGLGKDELQALELPYSAELCAFARLSVGGTILAAEQALEDGLCVHLGGGFHHAFADHGEGFCLLNDTAVAVEKLLRDGRIKRAMIVDCDVHQGNGTAAIFEKRADVFTFSVHQMDIYPSEKMTSSLDVGVWSGDGDRAYLDAIREHIPKIFRKYRPDLIFYLAGADPLAGDQLGGLAVSKAGLLSRDRIVLEGALRLKIPTVILLAGGYARDPADTADVHINTIRTAAAMKRRAARPVLRNGPPRLERRDGANSPLRRRPS